MKYATRPAFVVATLVVAASVLFALLLQFGLLGALRASAPRDVTLEPITHVEAAKAVDGAALRYDTGSGVALAQARGLQLAASEVLAVTLRSADARTEQRGVLGWLSSQDLRRPVSTPIALAAGSDPRSTTLLLTGHPRWRDVVSQVGLAFEARPGQSGRFLLTGFDLVPANPMGALQLLGRAWFGHDGGVVKPEGSATRLLPLALWFVLVSALTVAVLAISFRRDPGQRAAALQAALVLLFPLALLLTVTGRFWPTGAAVALPAVAAIAIAAALWLIEPLPQLAWAPARRWLLAAALAGGAALMAPAITAVALVPAAILLLNQWRPGVWVRWAALAVAVPALLLCAVAQKLLPTLPLLSGLTDPTAALAAIATSAAGLPGLAVAALAAHRLWPAPGQAARWSIAGGAAAGWALVGALLLLSVPALTARINDRATLICVFVPFLVCLVLTLRPKFQRVASSFTDTAPVLAKTEADLSPQALALLEGHADRVRNMLAEGKTGAASAALAKMRLIAAEARLTALSELRLLLAHGDLAAAECAATAVQARSPLTEGEADALLDLASRQGDSARIFALAPLASRSIGNLRALAHAQLRSDGPAAALATLMAWTDGAPFAREIADLHLLRDDLVGAQKAMFESGIALTDPVGQAYVARMRLRAEGAQTHEQAITSLAIWHPNVGAAQAAQAELLLRMGNLAGAHARFLLAIKLDPLLWPLLHPLSMIEARLAAERPA